MTEISEQPAWASPDIYPEKPENAAYGALSRKGRQWEFANLEALGAHVRSSRESVEAVWTPQREGMVPPEAVKDLLEPLRQRFVDVAEVDASDARRNTVLFSLVLLWALYANLANRTMPTESIEVGLAGILLIILGLAPWHNAWQARKSAWELNEKRLEEEEQEARFERWLSRERGLCTWILLVLLVVGGAAQIWVEVDDSVKAAGLDKARYKSGEFYRLFTAPFLHGHPLHWALNAAGLWYIGRRVEALAGWPHLGLVFLVAMVGGGVTTAQLLPDQDSVGASGGLLGLLGFLLVFETLHPLLVPRPTRRRLFAALVLTFLVGFVGYNFIDNYAHGGGLVAGMLYAAIVFPRSRSARRPRANWLDLLFGGGSLVVLSAAALVAVALMLAS